MKKIFATLLLASLCASPALQAAMSTPHFFSKKTVVRLFLAAESKPLAAARIGAGISGLVAATYMVYKSTKLCANNNHIYTRDKGAALAICAPAVYLASWGACTGNSEVILLGACGGAGAMIGSWVADSGCRTVGALVGLSTGLACGLGVIIRS